MINKSKEDQLIRVKKELNSVHRRLNRCNVRIVGLPAGINNLQEIAIKLCQCFGITVQASDIAFAQYTYNSRSVIVKFGDVHIRDKLMKSFFEKCNLKLNDVLLNGVQSRVFINDHLTPDAAKLQNFCKKLLKAKKIKKFRILNSDTCKCKVNIDNVDKEFTDIDLYKEFSDADESGGLLWFN